MRQQQLLQQQTQQQQVQQQQLQAAAKRLVEEALSQANTDTQQQREQDQQQARSLLNEAFPLANMFNKGALSEGGQSQPDSQENGGGYVNGADSLPRMPRSSTPHTNRTASGTSTPRSALDRIMSDGSATGLPRYSGLRAIPRTDLSNNNVSVGAFQPSRTEAWGMDNTNDDRFPNGRPVGGQNRGQGQITMTAEEKEELLKAIRREIGRGGDR